MTARGYEVRLPDFIELKVEPQKRIVVLVAPTIVTISVPGASPGGPAVYEIAASSRFDVETGTAGLLGTFGHSHVIHAGMVSGSITWDPDRVAASRIELAVPIDGLRPDFGMRPCRAAGGTIRVADQVRFDFGAIGVRRTGG